MGKCLAWCQKDAKSCEDLLKLSDWRCTSSRPRWGGKNEDLSFRIANKEWEYSRKRGYRNTFDRGVLQVHFRFKRYRYRR